MQERPASGLLSTARRKRHESADGYDPLLPPDNWYCPGHGLFCYRRDGLMDGVKERENANRPPNEDRIRGIVRAINRKYAAGGRVLLTGPVRLGEE